LGGRTSGEKIRSENLIRITKGWGVGKSEIALREKKERKALQKRRVQSRTIMLSGGEYKNSSKSQKKDRMGMANSPKASSLQRRENRRGRRGERENLKQKGTESVRG